MQGRDKQQRSNVKNERTSPRHESSVSMPGGSVGELGLPANVYLLAKRQYQYGFLRGWVLPAIVKNASR